MTKQKAAPSQKVAEEQVVGIDALVCGQRVIFEHNGGIYGGTVTDVSPGGYGTVVGFGFIAKTVHPSICTLNSLYH